MLQSIVFKFSIKFLRSCQSWTLFEKQMSLWSCNSRLKRCAKMLEKIHTSVNLLNKCHNCSHVVSLGYYYDCICIAHYFLKSRDPIFSGSKLFFFKIPSVHFGLFQDHTVIPRNSQFWHCQCETVTILVFSRVSLPAVL